ncbi:MAG: dockerin type I repeat-containing protein [Clostridia bacterium]|nr:dockerin type I repeat-containing protein [Clostridia bacterium]
MKRIIPLLLSLIMVLGLSTTAFAATTPLVARSFSLSLNSGLDYYNGTEYIYLDVAVVNITDPYGMVSVEFDVQFDGYALIPLWQTGKELNGDGNSTDVAPQMITSWPTYEKQSYIPGYGIYKETAFAAKGLCKTYAGDGKLNVNLIMLTDKVNTGVKADNVIKIRLYFTPVEGFENGASYTFTIDGNYDKPWGNRADITLAGTSGLVLESDYGDRLDELRIYGYGGETTVKVRGEEPEDPDSSEDSSDVDSSLPGLQRPAEDGIGDLNGDGFADSLDAAAILKYDAGISSFDEQQLVSGDVNFDGSVNSLDAAKVLKYDVGLIDSFK